MKQAAIASSSPEMPDDGEPSARRAVLINPAGAHIFAFCNAERPHQALGYETPDHVHRVGVGGGALIVDKFGDAVHEREQGSTTGQRRAAVEAETDTA